MAERILPSKGGFYYDPHYDINDGQEWTDSDIADLTTSVKYGSTPEETAPFLCRAGTPFEVGRKAAERVQEF
jgi:hypothetical protein